MKFSKELLKEIRLDFLIKSSQLSEVLGYEIDKIKEFENGNAEPTFAEISAIAKVFGLKPKNLMIKGDK